MTLRWGILCLGLVLPAAGPAAAAPAGMLDPGDLVPGQAARVLTVFAGAAIDSFDAEIVGVLRAGRAGGDMILARATSERVVRSGIAAGMSGSPVYVGGRLIGALSSGWAFTREPIFGITPIADMLDVLRHPIVEGDGTSVGPAGALPAGGRSYRGLAWPGSEEGDVPPGVPAPAAALAPLPVPLVGVGLPPAALAFARERLAPLQFQVTPGGRGARGTADDLRPGSAVAVDLMRGDLLLSAIGTVTWRDGDDVLLFGHPFFQSGAVRLPMSTAEITTIVASDLNSFKLGATGAEIGIVHQDRRAAVAGRIGARATLLPLRITIGREGYPRQVFRFETIEDRSVAAPLVSIAAFTSLLEAGGNASNETLRWRLTLHRTGRAPFVIEDVAAGDAPSAALVQRAAQPLAFLFANPFERLRLDSLAIDVEVMPGRRRRSIETVVLETPVVRPGEKARLRVAMDAWRGPRRTETLELDVPPDLAPGRYEIWVGGGHEYGAFAAERRPAHFSPSTLDEAFRRLQELDPAHRLRAVLIAKEREWSRDGRDYPALPGSARALLDTPAIRSGAQEGAAWLATAARDLDGAVTGRTLLQIVVDRHAP